MTILSNLVLDRILDIPLLLAIVAFYSFDFCLRVGGIVSLSPHGASVTHRMIHDHEVDYVMEKKGQFIAIEVKSNDDRTDPGLSEFRKRFNPYMRFVAE